MSIEQRLSRLERSNRQLKFLCMALCLALAGVFVIAADKPGDGVQDVVRAKKIEVVGDHGTGLILQTIDKGGLISAFDAKSREVATFGTGQWNEGGSVRTYSFKDKADEFEGFAEMESDSIAGPGLYLDHYHEPDRFAEPFTRLTTKGLNLRMGLAQPTITIGHGPIIKVQIDDHGMSLFNDDGTSERAPR